MKELVLRLNSKRSVWYFLGVVKDLMMMQARLSPACIDFILTAMNKVKLGQSLILKQSFRDC